VSLKLINLSRSVADLTQVEAHLLLVMCDRARDDGHLWPSYRTLAEWMHCNRSTVIRAMGNLQAKGLVERRYNHRSANDFYLRLPGMTGRLPGPYGWLNTPAEGLRQRPDQLRSATSGSDWLVAESDAKHLGNGNRNAEENEDGSTERIGFGGSLAAPDDPQDVSTGSESGTPGHGIATEDLRLPMVRDGRVSWLAIRATTAAPGNPPDFDEFERLVFPS
jgi:hypothetical protein